MPGLSLHVNKAQTGLWSDVQNDGTDEYAKHFMLVSVVEENFINFRREHQTSKYYCNFQCVNIFGIGRRTFETEHYKNEYLVHKIKVTFIVKKGDFDYAITISILDIGAQGAFLAVKLESWMKRCDSKNPIRHHVFFNN